MPKRRLSSISCIVCSQDYDINLRSPIIGNCGHSICSTCVGSLVNTSCPICKKAKAFAAGKMNWQLLDVITELTNIPAKKTPTDPKDCRSCGKMIDDDMAFVCVSCATRDASPSVASFLEKAKANRFCEECKPSEGGHEHFQSLVNVQKTVDSKLLAASFDRIRSMNQELCIEMQTVSATLRETCSQLEAKSGFPYSKKYGPDCTEQEIEEIKKKSTELHQKSNEICKKMLAEMYTAVGEVLNLSEGLSDFPKTVEYDALDLEMFKKVHFPSTPALATRRPDPPRTSFDLFYNANKMPGNSAKVRRKAYEQWYALQDKSKWIEEEAKDKIRYMKEMADFVRQ